MIKTNLKRRALALTMAMAMVMGTATVAYADDTATSPAMDVTTESGGEAGVEYYEKNIYSLTMPTDAYATKPFIIDPQGAMSVTADGGSVTDDAKGAVVPSFIGTIKNVSSFGVDVTFGLYVTSDLSTGAKSSVTLVDAATGLDTATDNKLFLQMYHTGTTTIKDGSSDTDSGTLAELNAATKDYQLVDKFTGTPVKITANGKTEGIEVTFSLEEAVYKLTQKTTGEAPNQVTTKGWYLDASVTDNYSQVAFCFGGNVAEAADWSDYGTGTDQETIALKIVYGLKKNTTVLASDIVVSEQAPVAPKYLGTKASPLTSYATVSEDGLSATITDVAVADDTTTGLTFDFDFGKAGKKATLVEMYLSQGGGDAILLVEGTHYEETATGFKLLDATEADDIWCLDYAVEGNVITIGATDCEGNTNWFSITFNTKEAAN